ncbi:hypothetical protein U9M48_013821 [Paspalum notatum var. saurae]|uniref:Uncharacterized protein n=1 Tax=Paspalum notatum var. saurae TaxID=547442 RepID=A0AAQ3WJW9_PASNO
MRKVSSALGARQLAPNVVDWGHRPSDEVQLRGRRGRQGDEARPERGNELSQRKLKLAFKRLTSYERKSTDPTISEMANALIVKFDKYRKSPMSLSLFRMFKRRIAQFYLRKLDSKSYQVELDKFNVVLKKMHHFYVVATPSSCDAPAPAASMDTNQIVDNIDTELDSFLFDNATHGHGLEESSELTRYLAGTNH